MTQLPLTSNSSALAYLRDMQTVRRGDCFFAAMGEAARARLAGFNPSDTTPDVPGVYEVFQPIPHIPPSSRFYAWWNGEFWCRAMAGRAQAIGEQGVKAELQAKAWREAPAHA